MTKEPTIGKQRIFSLELPDPLDNVDEVCNLMHNFLLTLVEAKKMSTGEHTTSDVDPTRLDHLHIHISYYERG